MMKFFYKPSDTPNRDRKSKPNTKNRGNITHSSNSQIKQPFCGAENRLIILRIRPKGENIK